MLPSTDNKNNSEAYDNHQVIEINNQTISDHQTTMNATSFPSFLTYNVSKKSDYGTLLCWATNGIGEMLQPCAMQVLPLGGLFVLLSNA